MGVQPLHPSDEALSTYLDGETVAAETEFVRRHLHACAICSERVASFAALTEELAGAGALACDAVRPLLSAELDGELERDLVPLAREHLASCRACASERAAWEQVEAQLRATPLAYPSARIDAAIAGLTARRARIALPRLGRPALVRVTVAAVALVAVLASALVPPEAPRQARAPGEEEVVVAAVQTVVLNQRTNTLFVLRPEEGVVVVRDTRGDAEIGRVTVGGKPTALALNEETNTLFVLDSKNKSVTQIDGTKLAVVASVPVAVSGTPTSLQVEPESGKLLVGATRKSAGEPKGELARLDTASRSLEVVRSVDVAPSRVVVDAAGNRAFLLSPKATLVLDATTYEQVASLPSGAVDAASSGGVTAILGAEGAGSRVRFYGANALPLDLPGRPLAVVSTGDGKFAALLDVGGRARLVVVSTEGLGDARDLDVAAWRLSYDPAMRRFTFIGAAGDALATLPLAVASAPIQRVLPAQPSRDSSAPAPAPPIAGGAASPSASGSTPSSQSSRLAPQAPSAPSAAVEPAASDSGIPREARELWPGAYFFELRDRVKPLAIAGRGYDLWFVDRYGDVYVLDTRTGLYGRVVQLPPNASISHFVVGPSALFALDTAHGAFYVIDPVRGRVEQALVPFTRRVVGLAVAPNGRAWLVSSDSGRLIEFDPASGGVRVVDVGRKALSAVATDIAGRVWYAANLSARLAVIGVYDIGTGRIVEYELPRAPAVDALFVDRTGGVWVSTAQGPWLAIRGNELQALHIGAASRQGFALGPAGRAWLLRVEDGVARIGPAAHPHLASTLPGSASALFVDNSGHVWVADERSSGFYVLVPRGGRPE